MLSKIFNWIFHSTHKVVDPAFPGIDRVEPFYFLDNDIARQNPKIWADSNEKYAIYLKDGQKILWTYGLSHAWHVSGNYTVTRPPESWKKPMVEAVSEFREDYDYFRREPKLDAFAKHNRKRLGAFLNSEE